MAVLQLRTLRARYVVVVNISVQRTKRDCTRPGFVRGASRAGLVSPRCPGRRGDKTSGNCRGKLGPRPARRIPTACRATTYPPRPAPPRRQNPEIPEHQTQWSRIVANSTDKTPPPDEIGRASCRERV